MITTTIRRRRAAHRAAALLLAGILAAGAFGALEAAAQTKDDRQASPTVQTAASPIAVLQTLENADSLISGMLVKRLGTRRSEAGNAVSDVMPVGLWSGARGASYDFDAAGFDGEGADVAVGIDLQFAPSLVVGAFGMVGHTDVDTNFGGLAGNLQDQAASVGVYLGWEPVDELLFDASFFFTRSNYSVVEDGLAGDFSGDRFSLQLGLSTRYDLGGVVLEPRLAGGFAFDSQVLYAASNGLEVPNDRLTVFRGSAGARASYPIALDGMLLEPWASAAVEATLDDVGGQSLVGDTSYGRFGAGLNVDFGPLTVGLIGNVGGIGGRDYTDYGGGIAIAYRFD